MNKISKTTFLKYLRCPRAAAFEGSAQPLLRDFKKDMKDIGDEERAALLAEMTKEKLRDLFSDIVGSDDAEEENDGYQPSDFDSLLKEDQTLKAMMETYFQIEEYSTAKAKNLFGGTIVSGVRINGQVIGQKLISLFENGYNFYSFVDTFQEDDKIVRIIESKSTTSRKFVDLGSKIDGELNTCFEMSPQGVLLLKEDFASFVPFDKYYDQRSKLKNRIGDLGRYVYDLAWQRYVIEKDRNQNDKREYRYYLSVLNTDYRYDGKIDQNGNNKYNPDRLIVLIDLTTITAEMQVDLANDFRKVMERIANPDASRVPLSQDKCLVGKGYRECPFLRLCKKDFRIPEKNSVYVYLAGHTGFGPKDIKKEDKFTREELIERGIVNALDVDYDWLSPTQQVQYRVITSHKPFIEKEFIASMLSDLKYPLFHLDFETMNYPLPKYEGEKPYQQSVFQYSLHIEKSPGIVDKEKDNISFLAKGKNDERRELAQSLVDNIPSNAGGQVIVYNQSFEKGRLKELASLFPDLRPGLMSIHDRVFDLKHFLTPNDLIRKSKSILKKDPANVAFYDVGLQRSYSIKKVLPIFAPQLDYANLHEVRNGIEAQVAFMKLATLEGNSFQKTYMNMLEYCKQDTWAMVEVLRGLRKMINEK
ncbi:MAG: DUF2779 domain-containing protein [Bacteroidia bacterium]|nr:DUF2779 domain-containing protein [Bacteroidia bacterium]